MKIMKTILDYLRERQTPIVRNLHLTLLILVICQIIVSNFMEFNDAGEISTNPVEFYGTWLHVITGLCILPIFLFFITVELKNHGFKYFFPYLTGEYSQLKIDINQLVKRTLPDPKAYGLAASVQGLGFCALLLVVLSGLSWFISWNLNFSWSHDVKEVHEFLTGLIQAYIIGHGLMGIIHVFFGTKVQKQ